MANHSNKNQPGRGGAAAAGPSEPSSNKLTFVVTTNPYDATSAANRRQVRSIAALKSWPKRRQKTFENFEGSTSPEGGFILEPHPHPLPHPPPQPVGNNADLAVWEAASGSSNRSGSRLSGKRKRAVSDVQSEGFPEQGGGLVEAPLFEKCTRSLGGECACTHCRFERALSSYPSPDQQPQSDPETSRSRAKRKRRAKSSSSKPSASSSSSAAAAAAAAALHSSRTGQRFLTPPESPNPSFLPRINNNDGSASEPSNSSPAPHHPWFERILHPSGSTPPSSSEPLPAAAPASAPSPATTTTSFQTSEAPNADEGPNP